MYHNAEVNLDPFLKSEYLYGILNILYKPSFSNFCLQLQYKFYSLEGGAITSLCP